MFGQDPNLFQTGANQYANSFAAPINPTMLGPGWGIDPNLMTPAYAAPFRPQYTGVNPYAAYARPSWAGGVSQLISPMYKDPRWGNPVDNNLDAIDSASTKPFDSAAWVAQRVAIPAIMVGGAMRFLGPNTGTLMGDIAGTFAGKGIAGSIGRGVGAGVGSAFGGALGGQALARGGAAAFGAVGGFLGAAMLPLMAGQALAYGADELMVQPYLQNRKTATNMMSSFRGVTFGDGQGNSISGRGIGAGEAHRMASRITNQGIQDMTFSAGEYGNIANMGMNAGLFDDVSSKKIVDRVKSVADQVKLIMAISRDPSVQKAIEEISKLHLAGAGISGGNMSQSASTYRQIGYAASVAGTSVQRMMTEVGAQGQFMYQMNGMTPYLGMLAASNSYAGFANAQRAGILGPAQLARMGGLDGAAQSSIAAQVAGAQTPYNKMAMMNQYMFGATGNAISGGGQSVTGVVSAFGQNVSDDPLMAQGSMLLYGNQMAGKFMQEKGTSGLVNQATSYLRARGIQPRGSGGRYSSEQVAVALKSFGLDDSQIIAFLNQVAAGNAPGARAGMNKAIDAQTSEQLRQSITQEGLHGGVMGIYNSARRGVKNIRSGFADFISPVSNMVGDAQDSLGSAWDTLVYGTSAKRVTDSDRAISDSIIGSENPSSLGLTFANGKYSADVKGFNSNAFQKNLDSRSSSLRGWKVLTADQKDAQFLGELLSKSSNISSPDFGKFRAISKAGGSFTNSEARKALYDLLKSSGDPRAAKLLEKISSDSGRVMTSLSGYIKDSFTKDLSSSDAGGFSTLDKTLRSAGSTELTSYDNLRVLGQAQAFTQEMSEMGPGADAVGRDVLKQKYPELYNAVNRIGQNPITEAQKLAGNALESGVSGISSLAAKHSLADYQRDPSLLPESLRKDFMAASRKGPSGQADMQRIAIKAAAIGNGGVFGEKLSNAGNWGRDAIATASKSIAEAANAKAQNIASDTIDTDSMLRITSTFDKSVDRFEKSVNILADRLGAPAGQANNSSSPASEPSGLGGAVTWLYNKGTSAGILKR